MSGERVLVVYHTVEGHSRVIAERLADAIRAGGFVAELYSVERAPRTLEGYTAVAVGGSVHVGKHHKNLIAYIRGHQAELSNLPTALFSVSLTAAQHDEASQAQAASYVSDLATATNWEPDIVGVFGGALLYTQYGFIKRRVMKMIAGKQGGDTDTKRDYDYTDWAAVDHFGEDVVAMIAAHRAPETGDPAAGV
jgi:menaquinone-dependent protoporphyrinogen oxidase